jgi:hypothetical protein
MRTHVDRRVTRNRWDISLVSIGTLGCILAVILGAIAASEYGVVLAGAVVALGLCVGWVAVSFRDPVLGLIALWILEVFNGPISAVFGYTSSTGAAIRQADEILVIMLVVLTVFQAVRVKRPMTTLQLIVPSAVGVATFGFLGAVVHGVPITVTFVGAWLALKLWVIIGITVLIPWKPGDYDRVYRVMTRVGIVVAAFGFADYLTHGAISQALHTSNYHGEAGGFRAEAVHSIFPHPGEYSLFMSLLFAISFARFATRRSRSDLILALLFAASIMLSLRLKGFLSLAAVALIVGLFQAIVSKRGVMTIFLLGVLLVVGIYSVEGNVLAKQVAKYTSTEESIRGRLYSTGEQIAGSDFPVGVGFGRYASYASRVYYSPVYYKYGLNAVYGLSQAYPDYIDDTSWPSVIGETGWGGFVMYMTGVLLIVVALIGRLRSLPGDMKLLPLSALCVLAVLLVDSLGDPTLFSWLATTGFAMILGPALVANPVGRTPDATLSP